jgi:two-component system sensor histidine kinase KdpD
MLCFNYFFLPPVHTWTISEPQNLVAWAAFTITAIIAGELSTYARRRAREAERRKVEIEGLYSELQNAFEKAAHAEALQQSEHLKSALLDAVTHDLRTPLTSIKASVTTLLDSEGGHRTIELDSEGRAEFLEIIDEETDRLNGFIEGMVELARLEAGATNGEAGFSNIEDIIQNALKRGENLLANHRVKVDLQNELPLVKGDARALAEVVYTLLDNAAKYSPAGSTISIRSFVTDGGVEVSISDEGPGIPAAMREAIFDKFVRLDKRSAGGLGLGLAIARRIVEAHKGTIRVEDGESGKGSRFAFVIPVSD